MIGNAAYHCSCVQYVSTDNAVLIIGVPVGAVLLLLLILIIILVVDRRNRRRQRTGRGVTPTRPQYSEEGGPYSRRLPRVSLYNPYSRQLPGYNYNYNYIQQGPYYRRQPPRPYIARSVQFRSVYWFHSSGYMIECEGEYEREWKRTKRHQGALTIALKLCLEKTQ